MTEQRFQRISDLILDAFQTACAQRNLAVAELLHTALERVMTRHGGAQKVERRDVPDAVLDSFQTLEALRREVGQQS